MLYIKNGEIRDSKKISVIIDGYRYFNPSHKMLIANGWEVYTPPIRESVEVSIEEQYKNRIVELIREKYSVDDELAILRQRDAGLAAMKQCASGFPLHGGDGVADAGLGIAQRFRSQCDVA